MTPTTRLLLASASPARLKTLRATGIEPSVQVSNVDEDAVVEAARTATPDLDGADIALLLARAKAQDVAAGHPVPATAFDLILGCDSVLEIDGAVHGKPATPAEAVSRWRRMRGRSGVLHTGHWLIDTRGGDGAGPRTVGATASTTVYFAALTDDEIEAYVATGEPLHVAGAFTVDGLGGAFITGIEGDHHNVVGLSLPLLRDLLIEIGIPWFSLVTAGSGDAKGDGEA